MMVTKAAFALLEAFMKRKGMLENSLKSELGEIFSTYPQIIAVYLFGSYLPACC
jgi:predicted nucleotidyltransferase